ncbi:MAG: YihY/virulence factor BrkB family protein [Gordonia sp. (in: high G+C Gram-positive bacteria)]|uniref:YihY/virulence factor BrkB family protein n=1 Tax=Gordonia sp. (in: high G+C Gram-positive bacteria) TaxID=84139 RepID=UPI0039E65CEE
MRRRRTAGFAARIDAFTLRHPKTGFPLAVLYKFFDDQGGYLAALIAYYGFVSLFPLLLVMTTVLGVVLEHDDALRGRIVDSVLGQIPVVGDQLGDPTGLSGGFVSVVVGLAGAIYGGLGVAVACQNAMNVIWAVPRNARPNPILVRVRGFVLLMTVGVAMVGLVTLGIVASRTHAGRITDLVTLAGTTLLTLGVFVFAFRFGTARKVSVRDVLAGAVVASLGWQTLQHFGREYVEQVIARAGAVTGVFATVLGLIAFLYLAAVTVVISMEINAVRVDELYPRSLLTEFTDDVVLTPGDERTYTHLAQAQRNKGFETITVEFCNPLDPEGTNDPLIAERTRRRDDG